MSLVDIKLNLFLVQSHNRQLLIKMFNPFILKVNIDMFEFTFAILLFVSYLLSSSIPFLLFFFINFINVLLLGLVYHFNFFTNCFTIFLSYFLTGCSRLSADVLTYQNLLQTHIDLILVRYRNVLLLARLPLPSLHAPIVIHIMSVTNLKIHCSFIQL